MRYDLCFAWNWKYDQDFATLLEKACQSRGISLLKLVPENIETLTRALQNGELHFSAYYDRASDADSRFTAFAEWSSRQPVLFVNNFLKAQAAQNKASCHLRLISAGLYAPYTIILPPYRERPDIPPNDLSPLGPRFTIKPAHGGGGEGVVVDANCWEQACLARQQFPEDHYLLQTYIEPQVIHGKTAWFRVLFCAGKVYLCWWDTVTHIYSPVSSEEEAQYQLEPLYAITEAIARICQIEIFSTEIARTENGTFVVVDYVNDPLDLRLQSHAVDGIPDSIVNDIAGRLADYVAHHIRESLQ